MLASFIPCPFLNDGNQRFRKVNRITNAYLLLLTFIALSGRISPAQTPDPPALRPWTGPLPRIAERKPPLLGDFIPCMFDEQDEALFHGVLRRVDDATRAVVKDVIQSSPANPTAKTQLKSWAESFTVTGKSQFQWSSEISKAVQSAMIDSNSPNRKIEEEQVKDTTNELVGAVEAEIHAFERPDDVSCSMAVLPWSQTKDDFGRHVAGEFVAIQVTVRNLNTENEFLLHDVQIAVDTQPGMLNRFQASMNHPLVRGVATTGQLWEPRNFIIRLAEFMGGIAASSSIPASKDFANGVAVFQGAFVPGLKSLFPDETINQLARLDDASFAASSSRRIVVPTRGSASFVTFIPVRPLESINFECLYKLRTGVARNCPGKPDTKTNAEGTDSTNKGNFTGTNSQDITRIDLTRGRKKYKNWSPLDLLTFQNSAYAVVAGVHVREQPTNAAATITAIDCPKAGDGTLDLGKESNPTVECKLTGAGLDSVSKIVLESATESTDTTSAKGDVTLNGGPTKATVVFQRTELAGLTSPLYSVNIPDKNGLLQPTSVTIKIKPQNTNH